MSCDTGQVLSHPWILSLCSVTLVLARPRSICSLPAIGVIPWVSYLGSTLPEGPHSILQTQIRSGHAETLWLLIACRIRSDLLLLLPGSLSLLLLPEHQGKKGSQQEAALFLDF